MTNVDDQRAAPTAPSSEGRTLLRVDDITLGFGGVHALSGVSFEIREGEVCAIIGPNGAGKTSMLNVLNGFYQPQGGSISYKGETRRRMRPYHAARQGIARTFQYVALFNGMSTIDNIMRGRNFLMKSTFLACLAFLGFFLY